MNARRLYAPVVLALLAAGGLAFLAGSRTWARATVQASGLPEDAVSVTGSQAAPLVPALAIVVVAGALAVLASSGRLRQAVGAVLVAASAVGLVLTVGGEASVLAALERVVEESPAFTGDNAPDAVALSPWRWAAAGGFVLSLLLAAVVIVLAPRWPGLSRRYERPASDVAHPVEDRDLWKALDEGRDPTE